MLKTILTLIFISITIFCNAQEIKVKKHLGGPRFIENGQYISKRKLLAKMKGLAAGGLALGIASIPLARSANKKSLEAVRLYNLSSKSSYYQKPKAELNVIASGNKIGLSLKF